MSLSPLEIDRNNIITSIRNVYHKATDKVGDWIGHCVAIIHSGKTKVLPYLQDQRVAAISLVAVNIILVHFSTIFINRLIENIREKYSEFYSKKETIIIVSGLSTLAGVIVGGVSLFAKCTKLPLNNSTILVISVLTCALKINYSSNS